jgi:predicted ATPase
VSYEFDATLLEDLSGRSRTSIELALLASAEHGLIAPSPRGFRFVHDRVREGAQAMLSDDERARVHFDMAEQMLARLSSEERASRIFELADHLNRGLVHVPESLRMTAVELNLEAGQRAFASGAPAVAGSYLAVARTIFRKSDLDTHAALGFELALQSAESAFRSGDVQAALALLEPLEQQRLSRIESARAIGLRVQVYSLTKPPIECVRYALLALRSFGVRWSLRPSHWRTALAVQRVERLVRKRSDAEFLAPATSLDLDKLATFLLIDLTGSSLAQAHARFATLAACHVLSDYLRNGYIARPGFTLAAYGVFSFATLGNAKQGERLGRLALEWSERTPDPLWDPRTEFQVHALLRPWFTQRRDALAPLQRVLAKMWEVGDTEYIYYADTMILAYAVLSGAPVAEIDQSLHALCEVAERRDSRYTDFIFFRRAYRPLLARRMDEVELPDGLVQDDVAKGVGWESNEPIARTVWLLVLCVYQRYDRALAESEAGLEELFRLCPWAHVADYLCYRGLAAAALASSARGWKRVRLRRVAQRAARRIRRWAKHGPDFVHMAELLEAEQERLSGRIARARLQYQNAAQHAQKQGFVHHAALAHERHADMLAELKRDIEAQQIRKQAIACYEAWGARAKVDALKQRV